MSKYDHLVHTFLRQENFWGEILPTFQAYFRGHDCMPDSNFYSPYRTYMKEGFIDRWPNFHSEEEYLCFTGYDMVDPWGSFDAEIEFWIGNERNKLEKHIITEPTIVRIPPFTWHCPLQYVRVTKPVYLQVLQPRGKFGAFSPRTDENGKKYYVYVGSSGAKKCAYDESKQCTFCGKCRREPGENEPKSAAETIARIKAGE